MAFSVSVENRETGVYVLALDGRLDANTSPTLEEKITPLMVPGTKALLMEMGKLSYISSAGVRVVLKARKSMDASHGTFIMTNLQPQIRKVFEIINALPNTPIFDSVQEADRYLDVMQREEIEKQRRLSNPK